jgi:hypothetical protein
MEWKFEIIGSQMQFDGQVLITVNFFMDETETPTFIHTFVCPANTPEEDLFKMIHEKGEEFEKGVQLGANISAKFIGEGKRMTKEEAVALKEKKSKDEPGV